MTTLMAAETAEAGARLAEALGANESAVAALAARLKALDAPLLATNARGSSDHAAAFAKFLVERELGLPCASIGPSIASLYGKRMRLSGAALLSISQSGRSPDSPRSKVSSPTAPVLANWLATSPCRTPRNRRSHSVRRTGDD